MGMRRSEGNEMSSGREIRIMESIARKTLRGKKRTKTSMRGRIPQRKRKSNNKKNKPTCNPGILSPRV